MAAVAQKYLVGLVALVFWPFGWAIAAVITNAMLEAAAAANLIPVFNLGAPLAMPGLTVLLIGSWMLVSTVLAPWITTKIFLMGANPAVAFAQGVGGVMQAAFLGGTGAAVALATGGAATPAVIAAAATGAVSAGGESAARGGGSPRMTTTAIVGMTGLYQGRLARRNSAASEWSAESSARRAAASETVASVIAQHAQETRQSRSGFDYQPHNDDPNQAAIEIESHVLPKPKAH